MSDELKRIKDAARNYAPYFKECENFEGADTQFILRLKDNVFNLLEEKNPEKYYCVRSDGKFGMSEALVNQLMLHAYQRGIERGKEMGINEGYDIAHQEVKDFLMGKGK